MSHRCSCGYEHKNAGRERVREWYAMLEDHLGNSTLGEDALRLAAEMAAQAAREMSRKRSKAGRDELMKELTKR